VKKYISEHWKGEHSLAKSFFINVLFAYLLSVLVLVGLAQHIRINAYVGLGVFLVVIVWGLVGTTRAAIRILRNKEKSIFEKINAVLVLLIALVVVALLATDFMKIFL